MGKAGKKDKQERGKEASKKIKQKAGKQITYQPLQNCDPCDSFVLHSSVVTILIE